MNKFLLLDANLIIILSFIVSAQLSIQAETEPNQVQVMNDTYFFDGEGFLHLLGEVKNNSEKFLSVKIFVEFYNSDNDVVATEESTIAISALPPNMSAPFEMIKFDPFLNENLFSYKFDLRAEEVPTRPFFLTIGNHNATTDFKTFYRVSGEVMNEGTKQATLVRIVGTFYDEHGKVIAVRQEFLEALKPSTNAAFDLVADDVGPLIRSYDLIAESNEYAFVPEFETILLVLLISLSVGKLLSIKSRSNIP